jgi:iron complex outermembrane recepter protein
MKKYLLFALLIPSLLMAQSRGKEGQKPEFIVTGTVLDTLSNKGLSFATLSFISPKNDQLITGGICDDDGVFTIEKVPAGPYKLLIEYIGYAPKIVEGVKVMRDRSAKVDSVSGGTTAVGQSKLDLGVFYLSKSAEQLQEIELVEEKALIVQGIDRKIFNVGQDITSSGGTAIELMEKLPSVQVDMDGNISLRGSDQVRLYVDGKPSMLSSSELLETMPSSMIESVELITNPSAKFSPEGMAGIINIVLKKNKKAGFNGNVSATIGYPNRNNFTALVNRRSEKLNIFGSYSFMDRNGAFTSESEKHTYFSEDTFHLYQDKWGENNRLSHTFKGGLDYTPNESSSISLQGKHSPSERLNIDTVHYEETTIDGPSSYDRLTESSTLQGNWDVDLSGKKKWDSGLKLDFSANKSYNSKEKSNLYTETILNTIDPEFGGYPRYEQLGNNRFNHQFESKLDFSYGNDDEGKLEWGVSSRIRKIDQDQFTEVDSTLEGTWIDNKHLENNFIYDEVVYAGYVTYAKSYGVFSYQAGLRAEQVNTYSELVNDSSIYESDYFKLYPSLHLNYKLDESSSLQASYSRRVNRPGFHSLNPFPEYSDPYNLRMGNPFLKPEFVNAVEMGYQKFAQGTTFSASVYAKDVNDMQRRYITVDSNNVSTVTYRNLNGSVDIGLEFMWSKQLTKTFNFMVSSNVYHSQMDASNLTSEYNESTFGMWSSFNAGWKKNGHKIQLSGWVSPGAEVGQGKMKTMFSTDLAYSRPVLSDKGKLTVKISDLFNTRAFGIDTHGPMFDQSFVYKRQSQFLTVSLSFNFGDQSKNGQHRKGGSRDGGDMDGGFF